MRNNAVNLIFYEVPIGSFSGSNCVLRYGNLPVHYFDIVPHRNIEGFDDFAVKILQIL